MPLELSPSRLPRVAAPGLYVHIPFCFHKCHYCDFYSITRQTPDRMTRFVDLVLSEADQWTGNAGPVVVPRTVFFGGGTPTLLPMDAMRRLINGLRQRFDFSQCNEWTVEANPATVTGEYFQMLRECGADRISMGAQSFDQADLAMLERHHDPDDVPAGLELARAAGFSRLNLDLIYAICGQTLESWRKSLETAISLHTEHLSCYALTYEANTPLAVRRRLGRVSAVAEEVELEMAGEARRRLRQCGLEGYEISNHARPGSECRHNMIYWTGGDYIGLGPSAASHVQGWRWKNAGHLGEWENAVGAGALPAKDVEQLSPMRRVGELAMLSLRLSRGLIYSDFQERFGVDAAEAFSAIITRYTSQGLLEADAAGARLTEEGWRVADALASEFLAEAATMDCSK